MSNIEDCLPDLELDIQFKNIQKTIVTYVLIFYKTLSEDDSGKEIFLTLKG